MSSSEFIVGSRSFVLACLCLISLVVMLTSDARPKTREVARLVFVATLIAIFLRA